VYVSIGASLISGRPHREFFLCAPQENVSHIETLAMVANYHANHGLDVGHTFPVGDPCWPGAAADHFMVSLPYPFGPSLELCTSNEHPVQFLWLLPVYASEARFRHEQSVEALEGLLERNAVNFLDGRRAPVA
jgi:hypothetical protein